MPSGKLYANCSKDIRDGKKIFDSVQFEGSSRISNRLNIPSLLPLFGDLPEELQRLFVLGKGMGLTVTPFAA